MAELQSNRRLVSNLDYIHSSQFRFLITKLPTVEYFVTSVNLPQISLSGEAEINTPFKEISLGGDTVIYEDLSVEFLVDEDLKNWLEVYEWIQGIGFPESRGKQYSDALANSVVFPESIYSDAKLILLTNKSNPNIEITFQEVYPSSLSGLQFTTQETDMNVLRATAEFKFLNTSIVRL